MAAANGYPKIPGLKTHHGHARVNVLALRNGRGVSRKDVEPKLSVLGVAVHVVTKKTTVGQKSPGFWQLRDHPPQHATWF